MKTSFFGTRCALLASLVLATAGAAQAASYKGTVTNKTTGKPSAGDSVSLVDVQAGMSEAATATTDAHGQYALETPNAGSYLIRVSHQGATYFIAAPQGGAPGDLTVYDVAAKVDGVAIDADMLLVEGAGGMLRVQERYLVRNSSLPPKAQFSDKTFEVALPADAELDGASATRPGGLATVTRLIPLQPKGHYSFNVPIQPDQGQKETLFEVQYHINYSGKYTFKPQLMMPADNLVIYVPKTMKFAGQGSDFQSTQDDPRVLTNIAKNVHPGQAVSFTVSGDGQMPRDTQQKAGMTPQAAMGMGDGSAGASAPATGAGPGGGIGNPIGTPDPLTQYKWWILGGLTVLLALGAIYMLRSRGVETLGAHGGIIPDVERRPFESDERPPVEVEGRPLPTYQRRVEAAPPPRVPEMPSVAYSAPKTGNAALLNQLKEELFAIESERISGTITQAEYDEVKSGLEAMLKRALRKS